MMLLTMVLLIVSMSSNVVFSEKCTQDVTAGRLSCVLDPDQNSGFYITTDMKLTMYLDNFYIFRDVATTCTYEAGQNTAYLNAKLDLADVVSDLKETDPSTKISMFVESSSFTYEVKYRTTCNDIIKSPTYFGGTIFRSGSQVILNHSFKSGETCIRISCKGTMDGTQKAWSRFKTSKSGISRNLRK